MEIKRENRTLASVRGMLSEGPVFVAYVWWKDRPMDAFHGLLADRAVVADRKSVV